MSETNGKDPLNVSELLAKTVHEKLELAETIADLSQDISLAMKRARIRLEKLVK
jgi:hypothetical protein